MKRSSAAIALLATALTSSSSTITAAAASTPPSYLFILSDDLGYGEISAIANTNTNISTPNIDALAASGMLFTDAYTNPVCAPSRCSLMTGQDLGHCWIRGNAAGSEGHGLPLRPQDTTFLEVLQKNGYRTVCVGKWGLGWTDDSGAPHLKGCDSYFGVLDQNYAHNVYPALANYTWRYPSANGSLIYESIAYPENTDASEAKCMGNISSCTFAQDLWTNAALAEIALQGDLERKARESGGLIAPPKPMFLYVSYTAPHAAGWQGTAETGNPVPSFGKFAVDTQWPDEERGHASVIQNFQDRDVGRMITALETAGIRQSTAVFFASDNGASNEGNHDYMFFNSSAGLRGFKRCLTEGGIRTPFIVSYPGGGVPQGTVTNQTMALIDMFPTLLDMSGIPASQLPSVMDGVSMWEVFQGKTPSTEHPPLYWEFCTGVHPPGVSRTGTGWGHAVRMGDWKGVSFFEDQALELYNLATDVGETTNVASSHPTIIAQMTAFAKQAHVDNPNFPVANCNPS